MKKYECLVGTYAKRTQEGILRLTVDFENGTWKITGSVKGLANPSYLLRDERRGLVFAACEDEPSGSLAAVSVKEADFSVLEELPTRAAHSCHLGMTADGGYLAVANYSAAGSGGSISLYRLSEDGRLTFLQMYEHEGSGPHPQRQIYPHVHFVFWDRDVLRACDFGTDRIWAYRLDRETDSLVRLKEQDLVFPAGSGPRHFCMTKDGEWLYVCCELSGCLHVFQRENGSFVKRQMIDSLPEGISQERRSANRTGAIKLTEDEMYLLVTNRGEDEVVLFAVEESHRLRMLDRRKSGSADPRELTLLDDYILVGHEQGSCITALQLDREKDSLKGLDMCLKPEVKPVCILDVSQMSGNS